MDNSITFRLTLFHNYSNKLTKLLYIANKKCGIFQERITKLTWIINFMSSMNMDQCDLAGHLFNGSI